jgi:hypothetical protein
VSLKDRLAGKQRRTTTVALLVTDPGQDLRDRARKSGENADLAELAVRVNTGMGKDAAEALRRTATALRQEADALAAQIGEHYADITLTAVPAPVWEDLLNGHRTDDGDVAETALPVMLAACSVDADLQDPDWWAEQLASEAWTYGDREALRLAVLQVNAYVPRPGLGKG